MDKKNGVFLKRLRETFRIEAEEHVRAISTGLLELEKETSSEKQEALVEAFFREAHSLKGAARSVNLPEIESLCQALEGAFSALKRGDIIFNPALLDLFHQTINCIARLVPPADGEQALREQPRAGDLARQLERAAKGLSFPKKPESGAPRPGLESSPVHMDSVRIPTAKLGPLLLQAEEMIQVKMAEERNASELREIHGAIALWKTELEKWKIRRFSTPEGRPLLEWSEMHLGELESRAAAAARTAERDLRVLRRMVDEHLKTIKELLMLPVGTLVEVLPKLVRDLACSQGKEVELTIQGADIEIDKRILEELKDPLIHLVRNGVDHGIKKPEDRTREGKPPGGTIRLDFVAMDNRQIGISVSDDGSGVDLDKVRAAAIKLGLRHADAEKRPDPQETLPLIFYSGISTSPIITDISGRGLGLAIVREKVEKLGGTVSVESRPGAGATFQLLLPMTLATFRGVLVRVCASLFVLPAVAVERVLRVREKDIKTVENRETIQWDGQILALARLGETLELAVRTNRLAAERTPRQAEVSAMPVVILNSAEKRMAFLVDEVLQEQEVLVKGLGEQLKRVPNIAGAVVLGNGKAVPVLNVHDLMKSAVRSSAFTRKDAVTGTAPVKTGRILVAEDSITSRTLLKNILETAGYQVSTAVDGTDALTQLRSNEFDVLVSDVDMPRMNGFELSAKIRADKKLGELPVVLVTALESREDKERGIEAGANAYIIKSSFDQSNLLEVIRRFL